MPNLRELVAAAAPAVAELKPTAQALQPVTAALVPLAEAARRVAAPLEEQLEALRPAIAATIPLAKRLPAVLDGLNPLLDHMRARAPEVVGFFTLFGDATSNYDINGNLIRVSTILIQAERHPNEIAATSDAAGSVVRPVRPLSGDRRGRALGGLLRHVHRRRQEAGELSRGRRVEVNDTVAKMIAAFSAFLLAASLIILYVTSNPGVAGTEVKAEFEDVYPLLPGCTSASTARSPGASARSRSPTTARSSST